MIEPTAAHYPRSGIGKSRRTWRATCALPNSYPSVRPNSGDSLFILMLIATGCRQTASPVQRRRPKGSTGHHRQPGRRRGTENRRAAPHPLDSRAHRSHYAPWPRNTRIPQRQDQVGADEELPVLNLKRHNNMASPPQHAPRRWVNSQLY